VVAVSDGDTITVLDRAAAQHKIRQGGIDAPEKGQAFGERSKQNLSQLAFDQIVDAHCHKRDRYGREVCKGMRGSTDVNLEQLRAGMAWWYREYAQEQTAGIGRATRRRRRTRGRRSAGYGRMRSRRHRGEWRRKRAASEAQSQ
jgi:endonuclease YncB( thermonuclease family)